jgi:hypothetical protein
MNSSLEEQIQALNFKVDQLHRIVLDLSQQIGTLTNKQPISLYGQDSQRGTTFGQQDVSLESSLDPVASRILHKDILIDEDDNLSFWGLQNEQPLTGATSS